MVPASSLNKVDLPAPFGPKNDGPGPIRNVYLTVELRTVVGVSEFHIALSRPRAIFTRRTMISSTIPRAKAESK